MFDGFDGPDAPGISLIPAGLLPGLGTLGGGTPFPPQRPEGRPRTRTGSRGACRRYRQLCQRRRRRFTRYRNGYRHGIRVRAAITNLERISGTSSGTTR